MVYSLAIRDSIELTDITVRLVVCNASVSIKTVAVHRARLVLRWATLCGRVNHVRNQQPRSTRYGCWKGFKHSATVTFKVSRSFDHSSFSRSRDILGSHQNVYGSRDLTTPLSGVVCHQRPVLVMINLPTKFEVSISTHYDDMKGDRKYLKWVVWGRQGSLKVTGNSVVR